MKLVGALLLVACRREIVEVPLVREPLPAAVIDAPAELELPPIVVTHEVKGRILDATPQPTGGVVVTVGVGSRDGVQPGWVGEVIDEAGNVIGAFTITAIQPRKVIGTSELALDAVKGKLVRLASPPP